MKWVARGYSAVTRSLTRVVFGESPPLARVGLVGMPRGFFPWWLVAVGVGRAFFHLFARWERVGMENLPREGGYILAANHVASADPPMLAAAMYPKWPKFMAKLELFQKRPLIGWLFALSGGFPVRRFGADLAALREAQAQLNSGEILVMFPEGHRSADASLMEAHPGTALIALRSGVPVVPVGIMGSERFRRGLGVFVQRPRVRMVFGEAFVVEPLGDRVRRTDVDEASLRIMREIAALIPVEYRGVYRERFSDLPDEASVDRTGVTSGRGCA
ncbi:MAG TPA: lysophospholipid acyltransferase family protein [Dehalococcoidia bacterium]|nr:lysophospholipid acyltransferase family protein [Dehalococcoidia bacterium]